MKKSTTTTLLCVLGLATIGGAGYLACDSFYDLGKENKPEVSIVAPTNTFQIGNLGDVGQNDEFTFSNNAKNEPQVTYEGAVYTFVEESVTDFSFGAGETATLCAEFVSNNNLLTVYYDDTQLLYIETVTSTQVNDDVFIKKVLYNAGAEVLYENKPFELADLVGQTFVYEQQNLTFQLDDNNKIKVTFSDMEYAISLNAEYNDSGDVETDYSELGTGTWKSYCITPAAINLGSDEHPTNNNSIDLICVNNELIGAIINEYHLNGQTMDLLRLNGAIFELMRHDETIRPGRNYTELFTSMATPNLTFTTGASSINPEINIIYNGVTYLPDDTVDLATLDDRIYRYSNGDDYIQITSINYVGQSVNISYITHIDGVDSEEYTETLTSSNVAAVAGRTYRYTSNGVTHQVNLSADATEITIDDQTYTCGGFVNQYTIMYDNAPVQGYLAVISNGAYLMLSNDGLLFYCESPTGMMLSDQYIRLD